MYDGYSVQTTRVWSHSSIKKWLDINEPGADLIALSEYFVFASL